VIVGVLSDSHGQLRRTRSAIQLLEQVGAVAFIHCGDLGDLRVLDELAGRRAWYVPGNVDALEPGLARYAAALGLPVPEAAPLTIELAGRRLAVFHGHEPEFSRLLRMLTARETATQPAAEYVFHGHTHAARDVQVGRARLINPGALQRAPRHTVVSVDLASGSASFWDVDSFETIGDPRRVYPGDQRP